MPALHIDPGPSPPSLLSMQDPLTLKREEGEGRKRRREGTWPRQRCQKYGKTVYIARPRGNEWGSGVRL